MFKIRLQNRQAPEQSDTACQRCDEKQAALKVKTNGARKMIGPTTEARIKRLQGLLELRCKHLENNIAVGSGNVANCPAGKKTMVKKGKL